MRVVPGCLPGAESGGCTGDLDLGEGGLVDCLWFLKAHAFGASLAETFGSSEVNDCEKRFSIDFLLFRRVRRAEIC